MSIARTDVAVPDTVLLNVAVIPAEDVSRAAIELSQKAQRFGASFQLSVGAYYPHLTLYMARFHKQTLGSVFEEFDNLGRKFAEQVIEHSGYFVTPGGYYEISYRNTPALLMTHGMVTEKLSRYRFRAGNPVIEAYFGSYSGEQMSNARTSGYDLAGHLYRPHVTLTRFENRPDRGELPRSAKDLSFSLSRVGLFRADSHGAARELIASVELRANARSW